MADPKPTMEYVLIVLMAYELARLWWRLNRRQVKKWWPRVKDHHPRQRHPKSPKDCPHCCRKVRLETARINLGGEGVGRGEKQTRAEKESAARYPDALGVAGAFRKAARLTAEAAPAHPEADRTPVLDETAVVGEETTPLSITPPTIQNPYKGLRAFQEADAPDFFGRETLIERLVMRLAEEHPMARFLAVVGPSGSGKSSVVKAGLLPALRRGVLPDSDCWFIAEMLPGTHPLDELEVALLRVASKHVPGLAEQLHRDARGLARAAKLILPEDGELLLVINQFEEVFMLAENTTEARHFLDLIYAAVTEPRSPVRVVITLRADFYDRPLMIPDFSELVRQRTEAITPLTSAELEQTIMQPAERVGVAVEPRLVTSIVTEMSEQPGALPMLQYALTELFERRSDHTLALDAYQSLGGDGCAGEACRRGLP
jgi:hypothetical protein